MLQSKNEYLLYRTITEKIQCSRLVSSSGDCGFCYRFFRFFNVEWRPFIFNKVSLFESIHEQKANINKQQSHAAIQNTRSKKCLTIVAVSLTCEYLSLHYLGRNLESWIWRTSPQKMGVFEVGGTSPDPRILLQYSVSS